MTKQLKWRLGKLPTVEELQTLVKDKIITNEEARQILFNEEEITERSIDSYKEEIKFLKEIIDKLGEPKVVREYITRYIPHYIQQPFYQPYFYYAGSLGSGTTVLCGNSSGSGTTCSYTSASSITDVSTF